MSNPRPESRIKSLEQRASDMEADIIELASDTAEEFRVLRQEVLQGFTQAHTYMQENIETRLDRMEKTQKEQAAKIDRILQLLEQKFGS